MFDWILILSFLLFLLILFSLLRISAFNEQKQDDEDQIEYLKEYMQNHPKNRRSKL